MDERPPFDVVRAAFFLVAFVLGVQCFVVLVAAGWCLYHGDDVISTRIACDREGRFFELLSSALSAALAFAGGMMRGGPPSPPPPKE